MKKTIVILAAVLLLGLTHEVFAQGTAFTYQGRLGSAGNPANGIFDLRFTLYDLASGGAQQGGAVTNSATSVSNGIFTVTLDFGNQFPGADRWLEIGVRTNGGGAFTPLAPRQQITSAPYAYRANTAGVAASASSVAAANITGTIPLAQLPAAVVTNGASGVNVTGTFSGNGAGLTNFNAAQLTSGTVPDARLSGNVALRAGGNTFSGSQVFGGPVSVSTGITSGTGDSQFNFNGAYNNVTMTLRQRAGDNIMLTVQDAATFNRLQVTPSGISVLGDTVTSGTNTAAAMVGNGAGLTALNASQLTSGTVNDARLSANVALLNRTNVFTSTNRFSGVTLATNVNNQFAGAFTGSLVGNVTGNVSGSAGTVTGPVPAANITGTIPLAQLPSNVVTNGASGVNITGTFSGNAGGLSNLNSAKLTGPLSISFGDPVNIGHTNDGGFARGVAVSGNYAYLANFTDGLRVYDISNPANPVNLGHTNNGGSASGVAVSGNYAYLANQSDGLRVYDISSPANPVNLGHTNNIGGAAWDVAVSGNHAYLANQSDGLRVYNISNPANPLDIGHTNNGGLAVGVAVSGNYAYLANDSDGLRVYNVSDPANPVNIGHTNNAGGAQDVAVSGNYAYLANGSDGLRVYDISNPANPLNIGHTNDGGFAWGVAVSGTFAYLANGNEGLQVYDISNPANPLNIGHTNNGGSARGVAVSGTFAYLANGNDGLRVYAMGVVSAGGFRGDGSGLTGVALRDGGNTFSGDQTITSGNLHFDNAQWILAKNTAGTYENFLWPRWSDNVTYLNYGSNGFAIRNNFSVTTMFMLNNGNVGIGTTSPGFLLEVNGSAGKPGGGSWSVASDERLKKNIRPLAGALDKLLALHGVNFEYIDPAKIHELSGERMGLLAQEVERVFPDWVETAPDGYKRVTVRGLEALMVEALRQMRQEQQNSGNESHAAIQGLIQKLEEQKDENAALKARLEKLERLLTGANGGAK